MVQVCFGDDNDLENDKLTSKFKKKSIYGISGVENIIGIDFYNILQ